MHNDTYSSVVAALFLTPFLVDRQENGTKPLCRPFLLLPYSFTQFSQEFNPELSGCLPKLRGEFINSSLLLLLLHPFPLLCGVDVSYETPPSRPVLRVLL